MSKTSTAENDAHNAELVGFDERERERVCVCRERESVEREREREREGEGGWEVKCGVSEGEKTSKIGHRKGNLYLERVKMRKEESRERSERGRERSERGRKRSER